LTVRSGWSSQSFWTSSERIKAFPPLEQQSGGLPGQYRSPRNGTDRFCTETCEKQARATGYDGRNGSFRRSVANGGPEKPAIRC
jgi:hypothetical protein